MKIAKRFLCLLMVVVLFAGIVACGSSEDTSGGTSSQPADSGSSDAAAPADDGGGDAAPADSGGDSGYERLKISYSCPQVVQGFDYNDGSCGYAKFILDKFNIEFDGINVGWGDWTTVHNTWIFAMDMPDVIIFNYNEGNHANAAEAISQELLYRLPDDWKTRWPGVAGVYGTTSVGPMLEDLFGGTYLVPRARFYHNLLGNPVANHYSLHMRKDWMTAVGAPIKNNYTIPEVLDIARLIKDQDPGGVGANLLPMTMGPGNAEYFFIRSNSTYYNTYYKDASGQYVWGAAAPETLEGLKLWYQAYSEGLLDPEFYLLQDGDDADRIRVQGIGGIGYDQTPTADVQGLFVDMGTNLGLNSDDALLLATALGTDGNYHQTDIINFWGTVAFSPDVETAKFERWMDLMEFTSTPDGYAGTAMGVKGESWDRDANGDLVYLLDDDVVLAGESGKYPTLGHVLGSIILWDDLALMNPVYQQKYRDISRDLYQTRYDMSTPDTFVFRDWKVYLHQTDAMRNASSLRISDEFSNLVTSATSEANLVDLYNAWIETNTALYVQAVLDELNS